MFSNSIFGDILKPLDRGVVATCVADHNADRYRKSFRCWDHLVAMLSGQLSGASSLRDLETVFNGQVGHHYHLRCGLIRRSTLSDANKSRDSAVFRDIAVAMLALAGRQRRALSDLVTVLDSSLIELRGRGYDWAGESRTRANNEGLKLHVQIDRGANAIEYAAVTDTNVNDISWARDLPLAANRIYVFDKGYCDYNWWKKIADKKSRFVTRLKRNAAFKVVEEYAIPAREAARDKGFILEDRLIRLTNRISKAGRTNDLAGTPLRLIRIRHPANKSTPFWIVSNALQASASDIAGWYRQRWSVELLFKWLKQNLKIKRFLGESRNAVTIQLYVAIIAFVLLNAYRQLRGGAERLKDIVVLVRAGLFTRPKTQHRRKRKRTFETINQTELWAAA